jgi:phage terminase large subunit-like protein
MIMNTYVQEYIDLYESGKIKLNLERIQLIEYLRTHVLTRDDLFFDDEMIENYIRFTEKWYFKLEPFQKFIAAFIFLFYKKDRSIFFDQFFFFLGRGGGKNGLISSIAHFFISPLHGIDRYNISIVANSELQAKTSFKEIYETIGSHDILKKLFYRTKLLIASKETNSELQFHTSNAATKDGLRDGAVIYDEVHQYENFDVVNVFSSGLGKVPNSREFFIGTDGYIREGFLDKLKERSKSILEGNELGDSLFPFICKLDHIDEVEDSENWEKANPMFSEPRSPYAADLLKKVKNQFSQLITNPSSRAEFLTKRMNLPSVDAAQSVADWDDILATDREIPDLTHRTCVGGLDFASIKDFAAVGLLFQIGEEYFWISHSFVRRGFLRDVKIKVPIEDWEARGLLTILDGPVIEIKYIVDWFCEQREKYGLEKIVADTFRLDIVKTALEAEGFELEFIRNPRAIHSRLAPKVETIFSTRKIVFGDNPLMRWYTNNVYVAIKKDGNKEYLKKDEIRRKTDGFQAFIHALFKADEILQAEEGFSLGDLRF